MNDLPSRMNVTAQPPPPAPVNLVFKPDAAVIARTFSKLGWLTPIVSRRQWLISTKSYKTIYYLEIQRETNI